MKTNSQNNNSGISGRDGLKLSALVTGALLLAGAAAPMHGGGKPPPPPPPPPPAGNCYPTHSKTDKYSYYEHLKPMVPWTKNYKGQVSGTPLAPDEMRITFVGSEFPVARRSQEEMSVFVEVGWDAAKQAPLDQFVFDCGSGVSANYGAVGIGYGRMNKIFLTHLHGDHMGDLAHIYCFGPASDRKSPLYLWASGPTGITYTNPIGQVFGPYDDGVNTFCQMLRAAMRWHSESFSFLPTAFTNNPSPGQVKADWGLPVDPIPVTDPRAPYDTRYQQADYLDASFDGYALVPIELDWQKEGIAYSNATTRVTITHFPVVHARRGSMGYKLQWTDPYGLVRSMVFSGDTKPETNCITQANNGGKGVDVFIHEMALPPEVIVMKEMGLSEPMGYGTNAFWDGGVAGAQMVEDSSHTPQGAFGYMLSQITQRPRLTVAAHFNVADDTVACAYNSVFAHCPDIGKLGEQLTWAFDLLVLRVTEQNIQQLRADVSDFGWPAAVPLPPQYLAKYWTWSTNANGSVVATGDPYAQIDMSNVIPATNSNGTVNFRTDGY